MLIGKFIDSQFLTVILCFHINPFQANVPLLYPLKSSETTSFLTIPGGMELEHWPEMR